MKIIDRVSAVEAIKRLNEEDLLFLCRPIVERLKPVSQARSTCLMARFTRGDRVGFQAPDGRSLEGIVLRLNKKTVSVATDDGHPWNVAPHRVSRDPGPTLRLDHLLAGPGGPELQGPGRAPQGDRDAAGPEHPNDFIIIIRNMLDDPGFPSAIQKVMKPADLEDVLGPYLPTGVYMSKE